MAIIFAHDGTFPSSSIQYSYNSSPRRSYMQRRQRQDLRPLLVSQLSPHDSVQPRPYGISVLIYQHTSIIIEPYIASIFPLLLFVCSYHYCVPYVSSLDFVRDGERCTSWSSFAKGSLFLHNYYYAVTYRCCWPHATLLHHCHAFGYRGAGVVYYVEKGLYTIS